MATKGKGTTDALRDAFIAANTPAAGARVLGVDGKWLRGILRAKLGVFVSRGGTYDEATRGALYDLAITRKVSTTGDAS
jgi:hypothetical protein